MPKKLNRILVLLFLGLFFASPVFAHLPRIADSNDTIIYDPEISQTFYGELRRVPAEYFIHAPDGFHLYLNLLTPKIANPDGRFSANVYEVSETGENLIATISADSTVWKEMWEKFGRDYYMQGPEFERDLSAGNYKIVVFNQANEGKYVLAIGDKESFTILELLKIYYTVPWLKANFFHTSVFEFFLTPFILFGLMGLLLVFIVLTSAIYAIGWVIKKAKPKSILD